jgi:hypothetical protein
VARSQSSTSILIATTLSCRIASTVKRRLMSWPAPAWSPGRRTRFSSEAPSTSIVV